MSRLSAVLAEPSTWVRIHGTLVIAWSLLLIPSLLWWAESVPWLVTMSCYANIAGSVASWQSAKADRNSPSREDLERVDRRLVALLRMSAVRGSRSGNRSGPAGDVSLDDRA